MEKYIYQFTCDTCKKKKQIEFSFTCYSEGDDIESRCRQAILNEDCHASNIRDICGNCLNKENQAKVEEEERAEYKRLAYLHGKYGNESGV